MAGKGAVHKREQISHANRLMFLWVAGASVIVGFALVISIFVFQKAIFGEKVLAEKESTRSTLEKNNQTIKSLKTNIRLINTNQALTDTMIEGQSEPVQVVLDALPSVANSSAFGASMQKRILSNSKISIDSLKVDPVVGSESNAVSGSSFGTGEVPFEITISASENDQRAIQDALKNMEKSIRPIRIERVVIETINKRLTLTAYGKTYYEPAKNVDLGTKVVKS